MPSVTGNIVIETLDILEELESGVLVTVDPKRYRIRVLPLIKDSPRSMR